ncbi:ABC-2 transporter permease [Streptosporangium sandarakinum]|uniref:ABC-2 transporter permease n=1 Tax=Streptosporangium sandarakinum TaxID=1260955 RepID=UPI003422B0D4
MTPVIRAIRLDLLALRPYRRSLLLFLALAVGVPLYLGDVRLAPALLPAYLLFGLAYPFALADRFGLETLYAGLGLRRRDVVTARYLTAAVALLIAGAAGVLLGAVQSAATGRDLDPAGLLLMATAVQAGVSVVVGVQFPLYLKFGYMRSKLLSFIPLLLLPVTVSVLGSLLPQDAFAATLERVSAAVSPAAAVAVLLALALAALAVSYAVGLRLYTAKDL